MKIIEETIKKIKENLISLCEVPNYEEDNYAAGYIAAIYEKTSEIFKAGVEFADTFALVEDELPTCFETGDFDGKRSELLICYLDNNKPVICRLYSGFMDGYEFNNWVDDNDNIINNEVITWRYLILKF